MSKDNRDEILASLAETYDGAGTALNYDKPFELLVAVIISAQCTDERVNIVTSRIFPKYNTPQRMGSLTQAQMEELIHDCGLFRAKAKNILATCHKLVEEYDSRVPDTIEELMKLPGVGKKTANVIANIVYNVPAIAVDTHVFRVSRRLGLSTGKDAFEVEEDLMKLIPKDKWGEAHHWLIWHGRKVCKARKPLCNECVLLKFCPYDNKNLL